MTLLNLQGQWFHSSFPLCSTTGWRMPQGIYSQNCCHPATGSKLHLIPQVMHLSLYKILFQKFGNLKIGDTTRCSFRVSKLACCSLPYLKLDFKCFFPLVSIKRGSAKIEQLGIKFKKSIISMKPFTPVTSLGGGKLQMLSIFLGSGWISFWETRCPNTFTLGKANLHF